MLSHSNFTGNYMFPVLNQKGETFIQMKEFALYT